MSNTLLFGAEESNHSLVYFTTDESDIGSFIGDHMSSDSASFEGFDVSNQSQASFRLLVTPSDSVTRSEVNKNNNVTQNGANAYLQQQQLNTECEDSRMLKCNTNAKQNEFATNTLINESDNVAFPQFRISPKRNFPSFEKISDNLQLCGINKGIRQHTVISQYMPQDEDHVNISNYTTKNVNDTNKIATEFTVDFSGIVKDISGYHVTLDTSPMPITNKVNPQRVAPQSRNETQILNKSDRQTNDVLMQTGDLILLQTDDTLLDINNTNVNTTNSTIDKQTEKQQSQTSTNLLGQTENLNFASMFDLLCELKVNITSIKNEISTEIIKNKEDVKQKLTADIDAQNIFIDKKLSIVEDKVDKYHADFTDIRTDLDICKTDITDLRQEVLKNAHQVEFLYTQIKVIQEGNDRMEVNLAEKVMNNAISINSKLEGVKGEVNHQKGLVGEMSIDLKQSKDDLEELKAKYLRLEGAVNKNRVHSDQLNAQINTLTRNMISGTTTDPELIETLLRQLTPRIGTNLTSPQEVINKKLLPSISSSPLVSPNFLTPQAVINQPELQQIPTTYSKRYLTEEEAIMNDIRKKEKTPSFDGSNISAPQFIEETEAYFATVNIITDRNKVNVIGSFLTGVASQWWKRIAKELNTWDEVKNAILQQYFNDYNRKKFKQQWKEYEYEKIKDVEVFTLQAFHLLDIVKPKYTFKRKCQTVASRLPPTLMNYLLQKDFLNEQEFMNILKEAMIITNFKNDSSPPKPNNNNSNGSYSNSFGQSSNYNNTNFNNGHNSNYNNTNNNNNANPNNGNNHNFNNGNNQIITNPNYKGRPSSFDPNFKQNHSNRQYYNGMQDNGQNNQQRTFNNNNINRQNNGRPWFNSNNNNGNRHSQRPYQNRGNGNNSRYHNQGGNSSQANPQPSVNNLTTVPASPSSSGTTSTPIVVQPSTMVNTTSSDNQDILQLANNIFQQFLQAGWQPTPPTPTASNGQNHSGPASSN